MSSMNFNRLVSWFTARPVLRTETLTLLASVVFTLVCNGAFWNALAGQRQLASPETWRLLLCTGVLLTALQWLLLLVVANRWTVKPLLATLAVLTAAAVYFMGSYGVYLDKAMLRNLVETDVKEAAELLDWRMLPFLLGAALPIWWLARVRIRRTNWRQAAAFRGGAMVGAVALAGVSLWPVSNALIPILREQKPLRYLVTPSNYIISSARVLSERAITPAEAKARETIAPDAQHRAQDNARKPIALVLVVGETVRAANWGLSGYARQTTPELAARQVINFQQVSSCGTDTATSVPCLFSLNGRHNYDEAEIRRRESLLHVLARAGVTVLWRDNQSGCKGVCDGLTVENLSASTNPALCNGTRCFDEILLDGLPEKLDTAPGDILIVLHMLGNHGPAYFQRYPDAYRRWTPTCDTTDLASCSPQALVNTYDNAILYSDHVLAQAIDVLAGSKTHDTGLIYVSDHGESLGEKHLYLHGMPYAIAPSEQTQVPMVQWFSEGLLRSKRLDAGCIRTQAAQQPASHDHLFHTLLNLLEVETQAYDATWDLLAACQRR